MGCDAFKRVKLIYLAILLLFGMGSVLYYSYKGASDFPEPEGHHDERKRDHDERVKLIYLTILLLFGMGSVFYYSYKGASDFPEPEGHHDERKRDHDERVKLIYLAILLLFGMGSVLYYSYKGASDFPEPEGHHDERKRDHDEPVEYHDDSGVFNEQNIPNHASRNTQCSCLKTSKSYNLEDFVHAAELSEVRRRREVEHQKHLIREQSPLQQLLVARPNSPLMYPIQGVRAAPLQETLIPGLSVHAHNREHYQVTLSVTNGVLAIKNSDSDGKVEGQKEKVLSLSASRLDTLNGLLKSLTYTSSLYRIKGGDLVHVTFERYSATFPIVIQQTPIPNLSDPGQDINSQVTITTKTFLRYAQLNRLIESIRAFYKDIKIIVADDSFKPQPIKGSNIEQYIMPPAKGWFAGRNLVVSQVSTKYLLWVDDDFLFTESTKIEKLVEVMEAMPELDVVGGSVAGNFFNFKLVYEEGEDGGCLSRRMGNYQSIPGFPDCHLTGGVVNFFLARTDSVRRVGFDPRLQRVAHTEFFVDGLGKLLVASCSIISVGHQPKGQATGEEKKVLDQYWTFRIEKQEEVKMKMALYYFKNRLKCFSP